MKSLNHCQFIGVLGKDPELSYTASGIAVAKFSIACNESWKNEAGEKQEKVEWVNIVAWRKAAEVVGQYLKKGSKVYISGKFSTNKYEKDGVTRYNTTIVMDNLIMLDGKAVDGTQHAIEPAETTEPPKDDLPF